MKILKKKILTQTPDTRIVRMEIMAPEIALKAQAGQFVVVMVAREGERIPLTVVDTRPSEGSITLVFQEAGLTTRLLGQMEEGQSLYALAGPLGHPTEVRRYGRVAVIGGGVGIAEAYPVSKALVSQQNEVICILGARTSGLLILEQEMRACCSFLYTATDDGSRGTKGFVTDVLSGILEKQSLNLVYAVGPIPMMRKTASLTLSKGIKTIVSLNALMVDATGMCGCCRVSIAGKTKFSCVDGPEFDAHQVDWEELGARSGIYKEREEHACRLHLKRLDS